MEMLRSQLAHKFNGKGLSYILLHEQMSETRRTHTHNPMKAPTRGIGAEDMSMSMRRGRLATIDCFGFLKADLQPAKQTVYTKNSRSRFHD